MNRSQWCIAFAVSLLVHGGVLITFEDESEAGTGANHAMGEKGLEVGLGKIGAYKDQLQQLAAEKSKPEPEPIQEPVRKPIPDLKTAQKPKPNKKVEPSKTAPAKTNIDIQTAKIQPKQNPTSVVVASAPDIQKKDTQEAITNEKSLKKQVTEQENKENSEDLGEAKTSQQKMEKGSGNNRAQSGGKKGQGKSFTRELMAWLNQHKIYPADLKKAKKQGTVVVKFTIAKDGQLSNASIQKSSGITRLDDAALEMLGKANPVPPIPDALNKQRLVIALPVRYSLETK